jgi:hypothetical protein
LEKIGATLLTESSKKDEFKLKCITNVSKNISIELSWTKNGKDLLIDGDLYSQSILSDSPYLTSVLEFKSLSPYTVQNYSDSYRCKVVYSHPEIDQSQGVNYVSDVEKLKFTFIGIYKI